jgi:hypothetical protein
MIKAIRNDVKKAILLENIENLNNFNKEGKGIRIYASLGQGSCFYDLWKPKCS